jgi:hypothetical protein
MGPGIRAATGMLLLLLHRLLRRRAQPARARKRSPIRREEESAAGRLHMGRAAPRAAGWGRGGAEVAGLRTLYSAWSPPPAAARAAQVPGPGSGDAARARPAPANVPAPRAPLRPGLARGRRGSPPAPAWTPRLCVCRSRRVLSRLGLLWKTAGRIGRRTPSPRSTS